MKSNILLLLIICLLSSICLSRLDAFENYKFLTEVDTIHVSYAAKLAITDNTLYVYGDSLLSIFSANNISHPMRIAAFNTNEDLYSIQPVPPYNLIAVGPMELTLNEIQSANTMGRIFHVQTFAGSNAVRQGSTLYIVNADTGMEIVDLGNGNTGRTVSYFHDFFGLKSIDANWPMVYALNKFGLVVMDASNLENPAAKGSNYQLIDARCLAVRDTIALVGTKNSLVVMSIKNPNKPFIISQVSYPYAVQNIRFSGSYAFVCLGKGGLRVLNLAYPRKPIETNSYKGKDRILDVAFSEEYVYAADGKDGIKVLLFH
jgi:hypothetical protein